jgi:hypothetical protein
VNANEAVEVYRTNNPAEAKVIKTALDGEGIRCLVTGEMQGGFVGVTSEVTVVVAAADADRARKVIEHARRAP